MPEKLKSIRIPKPYGHVEVRSETFNAEDRTVEVCWTTGAPVKRYSWDEGYYMEELAVDANAIRMDRFNAMSLLDTHDQWSMESRLGTVVPGSVRLEKGRGYATIKFSRNEKAESILQDLRDGHPLPISVGYKIHQYQKTEGSDGKLPVLRAIDWEPMELSAVPVPADADAISRSEPNDKNTETVSVRHEIQDAVVTAISKETTPMNKREAAKTYKGSQLEALAIGAGIIRANDETDEQLSIRLLAAYDAEDEAKRNAEEVAKRGEEEALKARGITPLAPAIAATAGISTAEAAELSRKAVANERKRTNEIEALARTAGFEPDNDLVRNAINGGTLVEDFRSVLLDAMVERQGSAPTRTQVETRGMQDETETTRKLISNAILHRHGIVDKLEAGANEWRNLSALDTAKELLMMRGEKVRGMSVHEIVERALHSTSDFPIILGDITRQTLVTGYSGYANTFQLIAKRNVLTDFREVKMVEVGNGPDLEKVNEHGEFKRGSFRESEEGLRIATYGKVIGLSRQMIINDQLGAFTQLIGDWGRKAAKLEGDIVWDVIIKNAKLKDGTPLFHSDHKNLAGTGTALDQTSLEAAHQAFRQQKDIDGDSINISPKFLFVDSSNEITAQKLINGVYVPTTTGEIVPQVIRSLQPVYEHRLDKIATKAWFLFASIADTMGRGLQYAHLAGNETPFFDQRVGFDVDGIEYKIRHDFGAGVTDYRQGYKNPGVAR